MQGGKIGNPDGSGNQSIYGPKFADEGVWFKHSHTGLVSMANAGPNTNGSQFFICYGACPHLDGKHAVFGRVISGFEICQIVEEIPQTKGKDSPDVLVTIAECGILKDNEKLTAEKCAQYLKYYF